MSNVLVEANAKLAGERLSGAIKEIAVPVPPEIIAAWSKLGVPVPPSTIASWARSDIPIDPHAMMPRKKLAASLTAIGFRCSAATLACLASRGGGPPFAKWGALAVYEWADGIRWAQAKQTAKRTTAVEGHVLAERRKRDRAAIVRRDARNKVNRAAKRAAPAELQPAQENAART
jgi:hypothetical protein